MGALNLLTLKIELIQVRMGIKKIISTVIICLKTVVITFWASSAVTELPEASSLVIRVIPSKK